MKTLKLAVIGTILLLAISVQSQVSVNVNITPPMWGPVGYTQVRYYYIPDVEAYYDIQTSMFIYYTGGTWIHRTYLPSRYKNYDLYHGYKVVMSDYHGNTPYTHYKQHKSKYAKGYHGIPQKTYGSKPGKPSSGAKSASNNHSNKNTNQGNNKNTGHSNDQHKSNDQHHSNDKGQGGGGHGKK